MFIYSNGDKYKGGFKNGKRQGFGLFELNDGGEYSGEWKDDKINGQGKYQFSNGNVYEGMFVEGVMQGQGSYSLITGIYILANLRWKKTGFGESLLMQMVINMLVNSKKGICMDKEHSLIQMGIKELVFGKMENL